MDKKPVITQHQPSMTEWFALIGEQAEADAFREEDNRKDQRMEALYRLAGIAYERPERFEARDLFTPSPAFAEILATRGDELCAIRLVPKSPGLPKLRQRGLSIRETHAGWMLKQDVNPEDYHAFLCPHPERLLWSGTIVVHERGVVGTVIRGKASQLTHGDLSSEPTHFHSDFETWSFSTDDAEAIEVVRRMVENLRVTDAAARAAIQKELGIGTAHEHLLGYFESTIWPDGRIRLIDVNRILGEHFADLPALTKASGATGELHGTAAYPGAVRGTARLVPEDAIETARFDDGDILVCRNTDVRYVPLMQRAGAIVTEQGGVLTHAAIVARELKKPCLVGVKGATGIADGTTIEVDATAGVVRTA